ncbi:MAG TPA: hypothetical protein VKR24_01950 [Candidatus Limnocylindrales bacterium]|nr:hypothetical protein [Candidatus Limnocylindrales bacterium]
MTRIDSLIEHSLAIPAEALEQRALRLWPGVDAIELAQCGGDPEQIAGLIAQHANLTIDEVTGTLVRPDRGEPPFYFG